MMSSEVIIKPEYDEEGLPVRRPSLYRSARAISIRGLALNDEYDTESEHKPPKRLRHSQGKELSHSFQTTTSSRNFGTIPSSLMKKLAVPVFLPS